MCTCYSDTQPGYDVDLCEENVAALTSDELADLDLEQATDVGFIVGHLTDKAERILRHLTPENRNAFTDGLMKGFDRTGVQVQGSLEWWNDTRGGGKYSWNDERGMVP